MFLSKLWFVSERVPPFLLFSTLIHEIVQTLVPLSRVEIIHQFAKDFKEKRFQYRGNYSKAYNYLYTL